MGALGDSWWILFLGDGYPTLGHDGRTATVYPTDKLSTSYRTTFLQLQTNYYHLRMATMYFIRCSTPKDFYIIKKVFNFKIKGM